VSAAGATAAVRRLPGREHGRIAEAGALLAHGAPLAFIGYLYTLQRGSTSARLPALRAATWVGLAPAVLAPPRSLRRALPAVSSAALTEAYVRWYSRFGRHPAEQLEVGSRMPDVQLVEDGRELRTSELLGRPVAWFFIRGNWCPLCMAQSKAIAERYREIEALGAEVALVAAQDADHSRELAERLGVRFRYLTDPGLRAARELGLLHEDGVPAGMPGYEADTIFPTVVVTNAEGEIVFCDQTDNYRVRPTPDTVIDALRRA
jgi:peroxiredoxin